MRGPRLVGALALWLSLAALGPPAMAGHPWQPPLLTIDAESLHQITTSGRPVVPVDIRPAEAFAGGRVPGARSIPLSTLTTRRRELPSDTLVVVYGAEGVDEATTAYRYLRAFGHPNVFVLEGGFAAWQAHGYGIER